MIARRARQLGVFSRHVVKTKNEERVERKRKGIIVYLKALSFKNISLKTTRNFPE